MELAMRRVFYPLLATAALFLLNIGPATAAPKPAPCTGCYAIFFGNGIGYSDAAWWDNDREEIARLIGNTYNGKRIVYGNAVNPSGDDMAFFRALQQKIAEQPGGLPWELIARITLRVLPPTDNPLIEGMRASIDDLVRNTFTPKNTDRTYIDDRVIKQVAALREAIVTKQQRVVLVGNSQGTLYANSDYRLLDKDAGVPKGRLKLASIASVADSVAGNGRYVTLKNDDMVNYVRLLFWNTLPGNIWQPRNPKDDLGHGFGATYMAENTPTRAAIREMIQASLGDLAATP
ncbi:MAG: hypothetical protein JSV72_16100 [Ralstonia sp.]|jgi:hypothetical protein|nr:MAG: hypothetical protein JSV72_16100 [Ralstonia sp.]